MRYRLKFALAACAATALLPNVAAAQEKLRAVASFSILGDMVSRVGGDRVDVKTLVAAGGDAHVYEPTPADAAELSKAQIVFQNGLKFEGWVEKLVTASGYKGDVVSATTGIKTITVPDRGGKPDKHGHNHGGKADPHAWQSAANAQIYVKNIKDAMCKQDAAGCGIYTANAAAFTAEIAKLHEEIKTKVAAIPAANRKVITSHDAFGYFAQAYGVKFLAPRGVSTESEASAKDVARLIDQIRKEKVTALFVENISDPRLIEQIARETKIKLGGTLYSDALSKKDGPASTYLDMMRHNANLIAGAMTGV
jgi:zinc/manganese transport system substrate-binding protein